MPKATRSQIKDVLLIHSYSIRLYVGFQVFLLMLWSLATLVEGAATPLVDEAGVHSVSHLGFWLAFEIFLVYVGGTVGAYSNNVTSVYIFLLVLGIAANGLHSAFSIVEAVRCTSLLCVGNNGILISFAVLFGLLLFLECVLLYHAYRYQQARKLLAK
jgi:hypothetical protein